MAAKRLGLVLALAGLGASMIGCSAGPNFGPGYRDVSAYRGERVAYYRRAAGMGSRNAAPGPATDTRDRPARLPSVSVGTTSSTGEALAKGFFYLVGGAIYATFWLLLHLLAGAG